ncbi:MAG: HDOD domain-containing protein [Aquificota bacterium]|nr:HDOD domain-containing protein [Aquificota bacterium]
MSFVIARQPVFDREGALYGYEVYLRRSDDLDRYPEDVSYNKATFIVAELIGEIGIDRISEGRPVFMNVTLDSILNKVLDILSLERMIFQITPSRTEIGQSIYQNALKRIDDLREKGSQFSVKEDFYSSKYVDLLDRASIVEFGVSSIDENKSSAVRRNGKKVMITKIEKQEDYERTKHMGDLFSGNLLGPPSVVKEFEIAPFLKTTLMRMIGALNTAQSIRDFANIIASDVGMSAKLLRFVNSAYFSKRKEIKDIVQACAYLGMENLKRFTLLVATNDYVAVENPELWKKSLVRAIISEEIAKRLKPQLTNEAYLVGLFSLIDEILGVDKVQFLKEVNVDQEIIDAFTGKNEDLMEILQDAIRLEEALQEGGDKLSDLVNLLSAKFKMQPYDLRNKLLEAQEKAEEMLKL